MFLRLNHRRATLRRTGRTSPLAGVLSLLLALAALPSFAESHEHDAELAAREALKWLEHVDRGRYGMSWEEASPLFHQQVTKRRWVEAVSAAREPFGEVRSRELTRAVYRTSIPGAPDGEYLILRFSTSFEQKHDAVETVTQMHVDKHWLVSGYFIR